MKTMKNFSFSDFVSFSESLVDSLDAVATKIEEVTNQIETLETVLEGGDAPAAEEEPVAAEENLNSPEETVDATVEEPVADEAPAEDAPAEEPAVEDSVSEEVTEEAPVSEEDNDAAAIDAMSTGDENFSDKFMVVGRINRPWGNTVINSKDFSEKEYKKLIPTLFSTQAQAQRALTSYNVNGENFSIKYNHVNNLNSQKSEVINASESRYQKVKGIFNM